MKILVTSGGTKIPIDSVRHIANMSTGTFGSKIASELLEMGHKVVFFKAKNSKSPFLFNFNILNKAILAKDLLEDKLAFYRDCGHNYSELEYSTFDEYKENLEKLIKIEQPDVIMLAAAVSDYGVETPVVGKVRSKDSLTIKLSPLPKLISLIKAWHPSCKLVGFKLLVGSTDDVLIKAASESVINNKCDMVVANDLSDIKNDNHRVHLIFPTKETLLYKTDPNDRNHLAKMVAQHAVNL